MTFRTLIVIALLAPQAVSAATLYFDPQERTVGPDTPFQVAVLVDAPRAVNAFDVVVQLPPGIEPVSTADGGSIVNYWIQQPHYDDAAHTLSFAGIVPGGFTGTGARLLTLTLRAHDTGATLIGFGTATQIRRNTPDAAREPLTMSTVSLLVQAGRENIGASAPDIDPPAAFAPDVITDANLFDGVPALAFATQDSGTGVAHYYVSEQTDADPSHASWLEATSPYRLHDTTLASWILVRAVDAVGNERVATLAPRSTNAAVTISHALFALTLICCLILVAYVRLRPHRP